MSNGGNPVKDWVEQNWTLLVAAFMFLLFLMLGGEGPKPPEFMQGSGLESVLRLLDSGELQQVMNNPRLRGQFLQRVVFWLVLPLALVFVLVNYAINSAIQDAGWGDYRSHGSEKLALPVATILTLMLFASEQYTEIAGFINGFGLAGVFLAFIAVLYIIAKTLVESMT